MTDLASPTVVGPFLASALHDARWEQCVVELIAGGRSNLTYLVTSDAGSVVLRRPPGGALLPSAHDMRREQTFLRALAPTNVPVPAVLASADGDGPLGAPFYVMPYIDGDVIRGQLPQALVGDVTARSTVGSALLTTLAELHRLEPGEVGLEGMARPGNFFERQLRRWTFQAAACGADAQPAVKELMDGLGKALPAQSRWGVVHGDFRLDNLIFARQMVGRVEAVLDWELATIGDPLCDLALLLVYWPQSGDPVERSSCLPIGTVTALPGFPTRAEVAERYAALSGRDLTDLPWAQALAFLKLAVITADISRRAAAGDPTAPRAEQVEILASCGVQVLEQQEIV